MDFDSSPILVFWETTRACELACRHCRAHAMPEALPGELTTAEGLAFVDSLTGFGDRRPVLILTGGDPFMRADLFDLVAHARSRRIPVGLAPSVTPRLTETALSRIFDLGVRTVSLSLDGARAVTHEGIRGIADHFDRTIEALRLLIRLGFTVQVNTTVMRDNVEELADVAALLASIGVNIWEVFFLVQVGRGTDVAELSPAECEDVGHFLVDAARYGFVVRTVEAPFFRRIVTERQEAEAARGATGAFNLGPLYSRLAARLRAELGEPEGRSRAHTVGTRDGKGIIFVAHDGEVFPAGFLPLGLGNVREQSIVDLYRSHPLLQQIRGAAFGGRCGVCGFRDLCGGSRSRAYAAHGDPLADDPACAYQPAATAARA